MKLLDTFRDFISASPLLIEREPVSWRDFFTFLIPGFFFLYFVFSTTITIPYVFHDRVRFFDIDFDNPEFKNHCKNDGQYKLLHSMGRPITARLECLVFKNIHELKDLFPFRLIVIGLLSLGLALLASWLATSVNFGKREAFLISSAIFTLPGLQHSVFMGNLALASVPLIALTSYILLTPPKKTAGSLNSKIFNLNYLLRVIFAFLALMFSMLIYPIHSFFFLVPTLSLLLFGHNIPWPSLRFRVIRDLFFLGACSLVFYFSIRIYLNIYFAERVKAIRHQPYSFEFNFDVLWSKLVLLYTEVRPLVFNFWNIDINNNLASLLATFVVVTLSLLMFLPKDKFPECTNLKTVSCEQNLQKMFAIFLVTFAATVPWLITSSIFVFFRIFFVSMAMALICLYWSGRFWLIPFSRKVLKNEKILNTGWALLLMLIGGVLANRTIIQNVWNINTEHLFTQIAIAEKLDGPIRRIHVIHLNKNQKGYNGLPSFNDEFNRNNIDFVWHAPSLVHIALLQMGGDPKSFKIQKCFESQRDCVKKAREDHILVTLSAPEEPIYKSESMIVIDYNDLTKAVGFFKLWIPTYSAIMFEENHNQRNSLNEFGD